MHNDNVRNQADHNNDELNNDAQLPAQVRFVHAVAKRRLKSRLAVAERLWRQGQPSAVAEEGTQIEQVCNEL